MSKSEQDQRRMHQESNEARKAIASAKRFETLGDRFLAARYTRWAAAHATRAARIARTYICCDS